MSADLPVDDAAPLGDFTAHRNARYSQRVRDALDADRWMDDGGFAVAAVALPTSARAGPIHTTSSTGKTPPCRPSPR
jgi:hypothetical protein